MSLIHLTGIILCGLYLIRETIKDYKRIKKYGWCIKDMETLKKVINDERG